ncbi:Viable in a HAL3 SIT4 background protein 2 [Lachancea thermotolerans]
MDFDEDAYDTYEDASGELPSPVASERSMIFERNVEEPRAPGAAAAPAASTTSAGSGHDSERATAAAAAAARDSASASGRHALEDLVAPALDASASIVNDQDTDLDNVEMIYSGRPSTLGLDLALGRTRTNSFQNLPALSRAGSTASAISMSSAASAASAASGASCASCTSNASNATATDRPRVLRFYSYADMLSDENAHSRRPSLTQSTSSSLLRQSPQPSFSNPFSPSNRRNSNSSGLSPGLAAPTLSSRHLPNHLTTCSRSPTLRASTPVGQPTPTATQLPAAGPQARKERNKFHLESSGSDCSTSDEESDQDMATSPNSPTLMQSAANSQTLYNTVTGPRLTRASTQNSFKKARPPYRVRTYSSASSMSPLFHASRASFSNQGAAQNLNDVLYDDSLQTSSVGDVLRKKVSNAGDV